MHLYGYAGLGSSFNEPACQDSSHTFQLAADMMLTHISKVGDTGSHCQRIAA